MSSASRTIAPLVLALAFAAIPASAGAAVPFKQINGSGAVGAITLGNELSCQVKLNAEQFNSFYPANSAPGDCGTLVETGGTLYSPDWQNHDTTATGGGIGTYSAFTPVSQTQVTGNGSSARPAKIVTTVDAGGTGLRIRQTDSYVKGASRYYRTTVKLSLPATAAADRAVVLYRAADCRIGADDDSYGFNDAAGGAFCSLNPSNSPRGTLVGFRPHTGGGHYEVNNFGQIWGQVGAGTEFTDFCDCLGLQDNGAGLSWAFTVPVGGSHTRTFVTVADAKGDTKPPQTKITSSPDQPTGSRSARFKLRSSQKSSSFECKLDKKDFKPCGAAKRYGHLKPGRHAFKARATDPSGNTDSTAARKSWRIQR